MGIVELATLILIGSKVFGIGIVQHWTWFQVLTPELCVICFYFLIFIGGCFGVLTLAKK